MCGPRGAPGHTDIRTHEHTDTRGSAQPSGPCRAHSCVAGLRPRGSARGLDGGGRGGHSNRATPAVPLRTPRRTQSGGCGARPLPGALPGAARPRSPFPKVTARRGAHLARGQAPGCSRPRGSPTLLSTGCCVGPAGGVGEAGGVAGVRAGRSGAERAPRGAAPPDPPPPPHTRYLCGAAWPACWGRASACTSCGPSGTARHGPAAPAGRVHPAPRAGPLTGRARGTPPALKGPRRSRGEERVEGERRVGIVNAWGAARGAGLWGLRGNPLPLVGRGV